MGKMDVTQEFLKIVLTVWLVILSPVGLSFGAGFANMLERERETSQRGARDTNGNADLCQTVITIPIKCNEITEQPARWTNIFSSANAFLPARHSQVWVKRRKRRHCKGLRSLRLFTLSGYSPFWDCFLLLFFFSTIKSFLLRNDDDRKCSFFFFLSKNFLYLTKNFLYLTK